MYIFRHNFGTPGAILNKLGTRVEREKREVTIIREIKINYPIPISYHIEPSVGTN